MINRFLDRILTTVGGALVTLGTSGGLSAQAPDDERIRRAADSVAHAEIAANRAPGMAFAVGHEGTIIFEAGYGLADVEMGVAASPRTVFPIASVTKQFTAAAVMQLVERGQLGLDDPITAYLPDYPTQGHVVTIRHLLNHTSGIRSFTGVREGIWDREMRLDLTYAEMLELFANEPFDFPPGERFAYNNSGYYLLGEIIGRVTGTPYAEYVVRGMLEPLGIDDIVYCDANRIIPNRAEGYARRDGQIVNAAYTSVSTISPASGGLCATPSALIRWTHLLQSGRVVSPASLALMTTRTQTTEDGRVSYGFGLNMGELEGHSRIAHSGSRPGFSAYVAHYPDAGISTVVLANATAISATEVEELLARAALGLAPPTAPETPQILDHPVSPAEIAHIAGAYVLRLEDGRTRDLEIFEEEGRVMARLGERTTRLLYQGGGVFVAEVAHDFRFTFPMNGGMAGTVTLRTSQQEIAGTRSSD